jgi:hypothetical protein
MTGRPWHVPDAVLAGYANDDLTELDSWSVESHVMACARCRTRLTGAVRGTAAGAVVTEVAARLRRSGVPFGRSSAPWRRGLVLPVRSAPALRAPFLLSVLCALLGALLLDVLTAPTGAGLGMIVVAPVLPLIGAALAYGPGLDPTYETSLATARGGLPLLLWRTVAVLLVCVPAAVGLGLLAGRPGPALWVVPCLALTLCTLAAGTVMPLPVAASVLGGCWAAAVVAVYLGGHVTVLFTVLGHPGWLLAASVAGALTVARRHAFHHVYR